jgi:hypothetical protein
MASWWGVSWCARQSLRSLARVQAQVRLPHSIFSSFPHASLSLFFVMGTIVYLLFFAVGLVSL